MQCILKNSSHSWYNNIQSLTVRNPSLLLNIFTMMTSWFGVTWIPFYRQITWQNAHLWNWVERCCCQPLRMRFDMMELLIPSYIFMDLIMSSHFICISSCRCQCPSSQLFLLCFLPWAEGALKDLFISKETCRLLWLDVSNPSWQHVIQRIHLRIGCFLGTLHFVNIQNSFYWNPISNIKHLQIYIKFSCYTVQIKQHRTTNIS